VREPEDDEQTRRVDPRRILAEVGVALLPAVALLVVTVLGPEGVAGRFRGALAGMVVITATGAFGTGAGTARALRTALRRVVVAAFLAGAAYGLAGLTSDTGGAPLDLAVLYLGAGVGACGLAALGRAVRTPGVAAGAVAACVLWSAMAGLFWADPVAEHLDRTRRRPFRQAVLHVDPALALAYGAVGYDRLRTEEVYFDVPLASSFYERPKSVTTGVAWMLTGLVAWGVGLLFAARRDPRGGPSGPAGDDAAAGRDLGAGDRPGAVAADEGAPRGAAASP
jgi:hypothetical protein